MKNTILTIAAIAMIMVSCTTDRTKEFIPGTYVNSATGEYSTADDTLAIEHAEGNSYLIHRRTGFNRLSNGKKGEREYETEEWQAVYDRNTKTLTETRTGKHITFYPASGSLRVGTREYHKSN